MIGVYIGGLPFIYYFLCFEAYIIFGFIFVFSITIGIIFCGNNLSNAFLNCLFLNSLNSINILSSNCSSVNAGFKSICNFIFCSLNFLF